MILLCHPKCTTCQKARAWLKEKGIAYQERDIKQENPTEDELRDWHARSGLPLRRFFNTSGMQYRALDLKSRIYDMTEDEMYVLLATDGMLVKRPLLIEDGVVLVGFRPSEWAERLG